MVCSEFPISGGEALLVSQSSHAQVYYKMITHPTVFNAMRNYSFNLYFGV